MFRHPDYGKQSSMQKDDYAGTITNMWVDTCTHQEQKKLEIHQQSLLASKDYKTVCASIDGCNGAAGNSRRWTHRLPTDAEGSRATSAPTAGADKIIGATADSINRTRRALMDTTGLAELCLMQWIRENMPHVISVMGVIQTREQFHAFMQALSGFTPPTSDHDGMCRGYLAALSVKFPPAPTAEPAKTEDAKPAAEPTPERIRPPLPFLAEAQARAKFDPFKGLPVTSKSPDLPVVGQRHATQFSPDLDRGMEPRTHRIDFRRVTAEFINEGA